MSRTTTLLIVFARVEKVLVFIAQVFVLLLMLVTVANIIGRFFGYPIVGSVEFGVLCLVFILYLGLAFTQSEHGHVNVDIVLRLIPSRTREIINMLTLFIAFVILCIMFWRSGLVGISSFQIKEFQPGLISFPIWPGKLIVPIGLFFFIVQVIIELVQLIYQRISFDLRKEPQEVKA